MVFSNKSKQDYEADRPTDVSWKLLSRKLLGLGLIGKPLGTLPQAEFAFGILNVPSYIGGNLIEGGADTTSAFLQTLILALVNFPNAQARAQEELDNIIGDERSPQLDDIERLPYIQAIVKEVRRRTTVFSSD